MDNFKTRIISSKNISVWGSGYLGYTMALKLHALGYHVTMFDFRGEFNRVGEDAYPLQEQKEVWSSFKEIPLLVPKLLTITETFEKMFDSPVHIIGFPLEEAVMLKQLLDAFNDFKDILRDSLVVLLAAERPGNIDRNFIKPMSDQGIECSIAAAFRSDWTVEEYLNNQKEQPLAANDPLALKRVKTFFKLLNTGYNTLSSIIEAEIFENARNALHNTICAFCNELTLAFPATNIRKITKLLAENISPEEIKLDIGSERYQTANSIAHMLQGAGNPDYLTLVKYAQKTNFSLLLRYADLIKRQGVESICILGLSTKGDQKDIRFSSSLAISEYLHHAGIRINAHDPYFTSGEIERIMPYATCVADLDHHINASAFLLMTNHTYYRHLTREALTHSGILAADIVIDNTGLLENNIFSDKTTYHLIGDGNLASLGG